MTASDRLVLRRLTAGPSPAVAVDAEDVRDWWQAGRTDGEGLAAFLVRRGVLTEAADRVAEQVARGYVAPAALDAVVRRDGPARLCRELALFGVAADPAAAPTRAGRSATVHDLPPREPVPGSRWGKFLVLDRVGAGGFGSVFRALHTGLDLTVALKFLHAGAAADFREEARLLARVHHPNVVRVYDFEDDPEWPYLVTEFVEGVTLRDLVVASGRVAPDRVLALTADAARGLAAAHERGVTHRDVKPSNLLIDRATRAAKLTDFGLATRTGRPGPGGELAGTPGYVAPDGLYGRPPGPRSDIYSLGATAYVALTGRLPVAGESVLDAMANAAAAPVVPPRESVPDVPAALSALVVRMLAPDPADRHQTYDELLADLAAAARPAAEPTPAPGPDRPHWLRRLVGRC